jgi:hypothetical protein
MQVAHSWDMLGEFHGHCSKRDRGGAHPELADHAEAVAVRQHRQQPACGHETCTALQAVRAFVLSSLAGRILEPDLTEGSMIAGLKCSSHVCVPG